MAYSFCRHPQLRCKTLILYVNWFTNALVYYGLALNSGSLGGDDLFLSFMINSAMEIPAYTAAILLLVRCGRRLPYATSLILAGGSHHHQESEHQQCMGT